MHGVVRGFTLIEQIITLAIAAILVGSAVPSMMGLMHNNRKRTATTALVNALHATRTLAIEHQRHALLCPSRDGHTCSSDPQWQHGWLIGLDSDGDGQPDGDPRIVHASLHGVRILGSKARTRVHYHADGSAPGSNLTLLVCPLKPKSSRIRTIVVSNAGRIRLGHASARRCR